MVVVLTQVKIVMPWSKSKPKPLSQQTPKLNESPPKNEKKLDLDQGLTQISHQIKNQRSMKNSSEHMTL